MNDQTTNCEAVANASSGGGTPPPIVTDIMDAPGVPNPKPTPPCLRGKKAARQLRMLHRLWSGPVMREAGDHVAGASNGPEVIRKLRNNLGLDKDTDLVCESVPKIDRDGMTCLPGRYFLTESGRAKVMAACAESHEEYLAGKRAERAIAKAKRDAASAAVRPVVEADIAPMGARTLRERMDHLEAHIVADLPPVEMPVANHFSRGVCATEVFIPANAALAGPVHKYSQINVLLSGEISVLTEQGLQRLKAPRVIESPAGTRLAGFAHTDVRWLTICGTHTTDVVAMAGELTTRTFAEYDAHCALMEKD